MVDQTKPLSPSDGFAIVLACLAGILALVLWMIQKTPFWIIVVLLTIEGLSVYPVLHFARSKSRRAGFLAMTVIAVAAFGWKEWPKRDVPTNVINAAAVLNDVPHSPPSAIPPVSQPASLPIGGSNILDNSGKAQKIVIDNSTVETPSGTTGTIVSNRPGGEINGLTIKGSHVRPTDAQPSGTAKSSKKAPTERVKLPAILRNNKSGGVDRVFLEDNVVEGQSLISNDGSLSNVIARHNIVKILPFQQLDKSIRERAGDRANTLEAIRVFHAASAFETRGYPDQEQRKRLLDNFEQYIEKPLSDAAGDKKATLKILDDIESMQPR